MGNMPINSRSQFRTIDDTGDSRRGLLERLRFVSDLLAAGNPTLDEACLLYRDANGNVVAARIMGELTVGRGNSAGLQLDDPRLSSLHFRVRQAGDRTTVDDLQSRNGTWVNGQRVDTRTLCDGDVIEAGGQIFVFLGPL